MQFSARGFHVRGVACGQGYLLERLGDVAAALGIACAAAERANAALIAGVRDGSVPLRALPAPAQARCVRAGGALSSLLTSASCAALLTGLRAERLTRCI